MSQNTITGLSQLNLEEGQEDYLRECIANGKTWFVTRKRSGGRCIQASGETRERVARTHKGWRGSTIVNVKDGKVFWPENQERKQQA
jgi:hypothetical protein